MTAPGRARTSSPRARRACAAARPGSSWPRTPAVADGARRPEAFRRRRVRAFRGAVGARSFCGRRGTGFPGAAGHGLSVGGGARGKPPQPYSLSMAGEVSPLGSGSGSGDEVVSAGQVRASHEDRDRVVELLQVAAGDGRLTAEELDERLEVALTARTFGELTALLTDLPGVSGFAAGALVPEPKDVERIHCVSGITRRDGRWVVPLRIEVQVTSGTVTLDFTEAAITRQSLQIDADVRSGVLTLVTKPGVVVDAGDVAVRSGIVEVLAPWGPDVPVRLRIEVSGTVGSGVITAGPPRPPRPPRRTFWQWLRRRPRPRAIALR